MLPIDRYTGHADLSPWNCNRHVLSDARMIGAMVAPFGNCFWTPYVGQYLSFSLFWGTYLLIAPPIRCPHVIDYSVKSCGVLVYSHRCVHHVITEQRISNEIFDALHRITHPKFNIFMQYLALLICFISLDINLFATPGSSMWKLVNFLEERTVIVKRRFRSVLCLSPW
jgi:hypothetical protein